MKKTMIGYIAVALALALPAGADTLRLRSGSTVQGTLLGADSRQVQFLTAGGARTYQVSDVDGIQFSPPAPPAPPPSPPPRRTPSTDQNSAIQIPSGTVLTVRLIDGIDASSAGAGQSYRASLDDPVMMGGAVVIPRGADALVQVTNVVQGGKMKGSDQLSLKLHSISVNGKNVDLVTSYAQSQTAGEGKPAARKVLGGAGLGAAIGAIAGGGTGAAIGALAGGGTGTAIAASKKTHLKLPPETRVQFTLLSAVNIG